MQACAVWCDWCVFVSEWEVVFVPLPWSFVAGDVDGAAGHDTLGRLGAVCQLGLLLHRLICPPDGGNGHWIPSLSCCNVYL